MDTYSQSIDQAGSGFVQSKTGVVNFVEPTTLSSLKHLYSTMNSGPPNSQGDEFHLIPVRCSSPTRDPRKQPRSLPSTPRTSPPPFLGPSYTSPPAPHPHYSPSLPAPVPRTPSNGSPSFSFPSPNPPPQTLSNPTSMTVPTHPSTSSSSPPDEPTISSIISLLQTFDTNASRQREKITRLENAHTQMEIELGKAVNERDEAVEEREDAVVKQRAAETARDEVVTRLKGHEDILEATRASYARNLSELEANTAAQLDQLRKRLLQESAQRDVLKRQSEQAHEKLIGVTAELGRAMRKVEVLKAKLRAGDTDVSDSDEEVKKEEVKAENGGEHEHEPTYNSVKDDFAGHTSASYQSDPDPEPTAEPSDPTQSQASSSSIPSRPHTPPGPAPPQAHIRPLIERVAPGDTSLIARLGEPTAHHAKRRAPSESDHGYAKRQRLAATGRDEADERERCTKLNRKWQWNDRQRQQPALVRFRAWLEWFLERAGTVTERRYSHYYDSGRGSATESDLFDDTHALLIQSVPWPTFRHMPKMSLLHDVTEGSVREFLQFAMERGTPRGVFEMTRVAFGDEMWRNARFESGTGLLCFVGGADLRKRMDDARRIVLQEVEAALCEL